MALNDLLENFRGIKGFLAAGILDFTGDVLETIAEDENIDLAMVGATYTDTFRNANEASAKIGLEEANEMTIVTPKGVVIISSTGIDAPVNALIIVILDADGNQALTRMNMKKVVPEIIKELG
ncbi:MAG: hypothetical protein JW996_06130 [Candidatus Cloacimonetes bacterium]|nr:hypothetical protein [Candidatus Cloacimonadota bacterium]